MKVILRILLIGAVGITGCDQAPQEHDATPADVEYLLMPGMEGLGLPFSSAVRVDNTLYLSGNIGNVPGTLDLVPGGIQRETRQTLDNIKAVDNDVKSTMILGGGVFYTGREEFSLGLEIAYNRIPSREEAFTLNGVILSLTARFYF